MWSSTPSGSGDEEARRKMAAIRRRMRPDNELPVSVAVDAVLTRSKELVVYLSGARVYSTVVEFRLSVLSNAPDDHASRAGMSAAVFGHGDSSDRLLLGVEYADGRTGNNLHGFRGAVDSEADARKPVLLPAGGGGGDRMVDLAVCLSPLPVPGTLRFIAAWPARGLPETVTQLDADGLVDASARVVRLWERLGAC
jgi:hypothetical protein